MPGLLCRISTVYTWPLPSEAALHPLCYNIALRWKDEVGKLGSIHRHIISHVLEDGTVQMRQIADMSRGERVDPF